MNLDETNNQARIDALSSLAHLEIEEERGHSAKRMFPSVIMGVFFIALLLALISGVTVYRSVSDNAKATDTLRQGAGLICNAVHANDAKEAIAVGKGPEGRSLVIVESLKSGTFETRFYLHQGKVLQEYSTAGSPYNPETASVVTNSSRFVFGYEHGLLSVTTDQGTAEVALRAQQGGK